MASKEAVEKANKSSKKCYIEDHVWTQPVCLDCFATALDTARSEGIEEAARVADEYAEKWNKLGSDKDQVHRTTTAQVQCERVFGANDIANRIRRLKPSEGGTNGH